MIVRYDGFKVFPSAIETVIGKCESVLSCCAVGKRDTDRIQGELPIVFIELKDKANDYSSIREELVRLCNSELPEYAQPVDFIFIDKLPLTPIGKIDYQKLERRVKENAK